jgi:hypothetical protein
MKVAQKGLDTIVNAEKETASSWGAKKLIIAAIAVIAVIAVGFFALTSLNANNTSGLATVATTLAPPKTEQATGGTAAPEGTLNVEPSQYAVRQRYFEEAFKPNRSEYKLFENAAAYLKIPTEKVPEYFSLQSEEEIFADLPPIAKDFSEIAYLLANGKYFAIGFLEEEYYKQPEFYPNFKEYGLRYWMQPDPKYWTPHGCGSYPAEQWATIKKSDEFVGVVFFYTSWGVQTFQGLTLMPNSEARKYFDIEITPQTFLLEPAFPKFYENWAYKIVIRGKPKPDTPPGTYQIGINVESPPADKRAEWEFKYRNIYFDAVAAGIVPTGNQIQFNVTVE